jgi:Prolyl oligopeptidase family/PDZ domain
MFYPGFDIFVLRGPEQITIGGIEDGPASRAGAQSSDVILSVNGIPVSKKTLHELQRLFSSTRPDLRIAGNLKGHLLLIHGTSDVNAPLTATMQMIDALIRAGKPYDLVLLPDQDHAPSGPYAAYYMQAQKRYLVQRLNP